MTGKAKLQKKMQCHPSLNYHVFPDIAAETWQSCGGSLHVLVPDFDSSYPWTFSYKYTIGGRGKKIPQKHRRRDQN